MSLTQISDLSVIPTLIQAYSSQYNPTSTAFMQSGVMVPVTPLNTDFTSGGQYHTLPFWNFLANSDPNLSSDDPNTSATPLKVGSGQMKCRLAMLNNSWSAADIVTPLAGSDPLQHVVNEQGKYWNLVIQKRLINSMLGILADNVANHSSDMVKSVVASANAGVQATNLISRNAVIDAQATAGDAAGALNAIAVHSAVYAQLLKNNEIQSLRDSDNGLIEFYMGKRVIVCDELGSSTVNGYTAYTSILFGAGAVGFGEGQPRVPVGVQRFELQGSGGGVETIVFRKHMAIHPLGYTWTDSSVAGESATNAELAAAANWTRVYDRKNIPIAFLKSNG